MSKVGAIECQAELADGGSALLLIWLTISFKHTMMLYRFNTEDTLMSTNKIPSLDLEEHIHHCWNITKDIDTLYEGVLNVGMTTDQIANTLLGLYQLYELKFDALWLSCERLWAEQAKIADERTKLKQKLQMQDNDLANHLAVINQLETQLSQARVTTAGDEYDDAKRSMGLNDDIQSK